VSIGQVTATWDKQPIHVRIAGPVARSTEVIEHVDGTDPSTVHTLPGRTRFEPLVLERDITADRRFADWADLVLSASASPATAFRKDVVIQVFDATGSPLVSFQLLRAWPSTYRALARLDASADAPPCEVLELRHDGWVRLV
jgi:phage tail-like protein